MNENDRLESLVSSVRDLMISPGIECAADLSPNVLKKSIAHPQNHQHYLQTVSPLADRVVQAVLGRRTRLSDIRNLPEWTAELTAVLKALEYPGVGETIRLNQDSKRDILEFLTSEAKCLRLSSSDRRSALENDPKGALKGAVRALGLSSPPADGSVTAKLLFDKLGSTFMQKLTKITPLLNQPLNEAQWSLLEKTRDELNDEYSLRWIVMLARLDSTIGSFTWSNRASEKVKKRVTALYEERKAGMTSVRPHVDLPDLMTATERSIRFKKLASSANKASSQSEFTKVKMGAVPDRGGRPRACEAPPPERPCWAARSDGGGRGGGRGGYNNRGGRGGYNDHRGGGRSGYNDNRGGYNNNRGGRGGGYHDNRSGGGDHDNRSGGGRGYHDDRRGSGRDDYDDSRGHRGGHHNQHHNEKRRRVQNAGWDSRY